MILYHVERQNVIHEGGSATDEGNAHHNERNENQDVNANVNLRHVQVIHPFFKRRLQAHPNGQTEQSASADLLLRNRHNNMSNQKENG